jgi:hypothetical protein
VILTRAHKPRGPLLAAVCVTALFVGGNVVAQGVPVTDLSKVLQDKLRLLENEFSSEENTDKTNALETKNDIHAQQLDALDATLKQLTTSGLDLPSMEGAGGYEASEVYAIEDNNPYKDRLFGDARVSIEQMIIETARRFGGHPALQRAGINPTEFRIWFQSLIKQESGFSIGARSNKAAFGLTQIIPGTAKYLGIYPAYYNDPRLQLDGGARYLLEQLSKFGRMELALAAYNAGPGAVQKFNGIPPYPETQNYVRSIRAHYNKYALKISGVDSLGTLSPSEMARAEQSNISDAGMHYGMYSASLMVQSISRLKDLVGRIPNTSTTLEAMQLNSYVRAEVTRIAYAHARLSAAQRKIEAAKYGTLFAAYARDELFLDLSGVSQ